MQKYKDKNIITKFGRAPDKIHLEEGVLEFSDYAQEFKHILGCDGINSSVREEMMKKGKFEWKKIMDDLVFLETRVKAPAGVAPERMHYCFGPTSHLMMTPIRDGYEHDPVHL